jgi:hypothetical protein
MVVGVIAVYFIYKKRCKLIKIENDAFQPYERPFILVHSEFRPYMMKIAEYANNCKVKVLVTSSFRYNSDLKDPIVKPSKKSNHMAGHAIDMNLLYGDDY